MKLLKGDIVHAPALGALETIPDGALLLDDDGTICEVLHEQPQDFDGEIFDCTGKLIMQSFADMHLHAPQFPNVGTGMDLPLLDWLKAYTFPVEAKFADLSYARRVYRRLARDLIANGTTRVCMFSSLHTDATLVLMEELERAGVTGFVGKVNMDRNGGENLQETTEESIRETLRWLAECSRFTRIKPILTPRFTPACTDELMAALTEAGADTGADRRIFRKASMRSRGCAICTPTARSTGRATINSVCGRTAPSWRTASTRMRASAAPSVRPVLSSRTARTPTSTCAAASRRCGRC